VSKYRLVREEDREPRSHAEKKRAKAKAKAERKGKLGAIVSMKAGARPLEDA